MVKFGIPKKTQPSRAIQRKILQTNIVNIKWSVIYFFKCFISYSLNFITENFVHIVAHLVNGNFGLCNVVDINTNTYRYVSSKPIKTRLITQLICKRNASTTGQYLGKCLKLKSLLLKIWQILLKIPSCKISPYCLIVTLDLSSSDSR